MACRANAGWLAVLGALALAPGAHALPADNFDDNPRAGTWTEIEDNAALLSIAEQNARLEAASSKASASDLDAIYLSNGPAGFALSAGQSFQMRVSYDLTAPLAAGATSGSDWAFALDFGFGTTAGGENSFSAAAGWAPVPIIGAARGLGYGYRVNDVQTVVPTGFAGPSGTLYLSYDEPTDTIRFSDVGYNDPSPDAVIPGLVRGQWNASQLLVAFGARGRGVDIAPGAAWLDNFVVDAGTVVPIPEPAGATLALAGCAAALVGRRRRSR